MIKAYFFLAFVYIRYYQPDNDFSALASLGSGRDPNIKRCIL
jgi:hypothetical protein